MTTTFIIVYIVIALILIGLINVLFQNQEKAKDQKWNNVRLNSENQSYQSKFKASDLDKQSESNNASSQIRNHSDNIEDDKRKHHFETTNEEIKHLLKLLMQIANMMHILVLSRRSDQHEDQANDEKQDHQKDNTEQPNEESDEVLNPIDPNSEEGRVNEKIKNKNLTSFSVKVFQEVKF